MGSNVRCIALYTKYLFCKRDWVGKKKLLRILFLKSNQHCSRFSSNCFLAF